MKILLAPIAGALLFAAASPALAQATAPAAPAAQSDDQAKLAEAHAVIEIMFPPATRDGMMTKMMNQLTAPVAQSLPMTGITDQGLKAIFKDYMSDVFGAMRTLVVQHLPAMTDAMAEAYTHQFTLAELKDIHAFALTPAGQDYFSHALTIVGDPAVQKVNATMIADSRTALEPAMARLKDKIAAYVKAHPEAEQQLKTLASAQMQAK